MNLLQVNVILCIVYVLIIQCSKISFIQKNKIYLIITYLQLFFIHTFVDYDSVPDLAGYEDMFGMFGNCSWLECLNFSTGIEPGYAIINKFLYSLGLSFRSVNIIYNLCFISALYSVLSRYSYYPKLSIIIIVLTIFNQSIFVVRQFWALSIILLSLKHVIDRKVVPFVLMVLLATTFHITALIFMPVYFLYGLNKTKLITALISIGILSILSIQAILVYGGLLIQAKSEYLDGDSQMSVIPLVEALLLFSCYSIGMRGKVFEVGINKLLFILCAMSVCICLGAVGQSAIFIRLNLYFSITPFLIFPVLIFSARGNSNKCIIYTLILIFYYILTFQSSSFDYLKDFAIKVF